VGEVSRGGCEPVSARAAGARAAPSSSRRARAPSASAPAFRCCRRTKVRSAP